MIPLWPSYYMTKKAQNTISQAEIKHYNESRSVRTQATRWLQITTDIGIKIEVETERK